MTVTVSESITLKNKLSETEHSESWEVFDRAKKKKLVLKQFQVQNTESSSAFQNGITLWNELREDNPDISVPVITFGGLDNDILWYTREFVTGELWLIHSALKEREAVKKITSLINFVTKLHQKGITHRNLKPSNIFTIGNDSIAVDADLGGLGSSNGVWADDIKGLVQLYAYLVTGQMPEMLDLGTVPEQSRSFVTESLQNPPSSLAELRSTLDKIGKAARPSAFVQESNAVQTPESTTETAARSAASPPNNAGDLPPQGVVCPQCRIAVQDISARACPQCGRAYYEPCLNCQTLNPFWITTCRSCNGDLLALKQGLYATLNTQKQQILKYRESYGHEKTLPLLKYMSTVNHPDFVAFREWSKNMMLLIQKERKDIKNYVENIRAQVAAAMQSQQYDRVQQILDQVPRPLVDEPLRQLYSEAGEAIKEVDSLVKEIRNALSTKQYSQLLSCVQRYLELKANDPEAQNLQKKIEKLTTITSTKGMKLRRIPGGRFYMGSHDSDEYLRNNEHPQHRVVISHNLFIGVYPVTQKEFQELMEFNPSTAVENEECPVDSVSWYSAVEFCNKMSELESFTPYYELKSVKRRASGLIEKADVTTLGGDGYRLPTEAEWEYACRAGSITPWCFGDQVQDVGEYAWYIDNSTLETHPVGQRKSNSWGVYDMHGNVMEWCHDWYADFYYAQCPDEDENPTGPEDGTAKVLRGGAWQFGAEATRCAYRNSSIPDAVAAVIGFRVCRNSRDDVM